MNNSLEHVRPWQAGLQRSRLGIAILASLGMLLSACSGSTRLELDNTSFPVPLMEKSPVSLGIHLDEALTTFVHKETFEKKGEWEVSIGPAQRQLFDHLAQGVFEGYQFVDTLTVDAPLDGVLRPTIREVQFSLPSQTRSNYYEVWIRYEFQLYDRAGNPVGDWNLPAYGKASNKNYGSASGGLQAAALAACRDAMAFFSINFAREPVVRKWLADGKPLMPPPPPTPDASPAPAPSEDNSLASDAQAEQA